MALVIILRRKIRPMERALITTAGIVLVIIARITIIERMLVALKYKKGSKNRCYRFY